MKRIVVKPGEKYNMLTFIRYTGCKRNGSEIWECRCDCGKTTYIKKTFVTSGHTKSCGCQKHKGYPKHGKCETRIYNTHQKMKQRCYKEYEKEYHNYGGRGITVCDEWLGEDGFINFYNWAMANGYQDNLTLDRIDVNGNYEPDNCRWVDMVVQQNNRRNNYYITYKGKTKTLAEWSRELGISENALDNRLKKWNIDDAFNTPVNSHIHLLTYKNQTHSIPEWSDITGINEWTIRRRIKHGWSIEKVLTKKPKYKEVEK